MEQGVTDLLIAGALGGRLDHCLANLMAGIPLLLERIKVCYISTGLCVYLCSDDLSLHGQAGDLVSLLPLSDQVSGVTLKGFEYPLQQALLTRDNPYAISNVLLGSSGEIVITEGVAAVFHYQSPEEEP